MTRKKTLQRSELDFHISNKFKHFSKNHQNFINILDDDSTKMVFASGAAGTNKTYLSVWSALKALQEGKCDNIIYIRSVVESADRNIGSLPGEIDEKFAPWSIPMVEKLEELISNKQAIHQLMVKKLIQCIPVNFARGRTFKRSFVIFDEAQNSTVSEIKTILTRFGEESKYVILGDPLQSDINGKSGFHCIRDKFDSEDSEENGIYVVKFTEDDIVRSGILKFIVETLEARDGVWQVSKRK